MDYTPSRYSQTKESPQKDILSLTSTTLVRNLKITNFKTNQNWLFLYFEGCSIPLSIPTNHTMTFGTETISAFDYLKRVLEKGDHIDVIVNCAYKDSIKIELFWIHIVYIGQPADAGNFSQKEDGLFALRAKAGEKAERVAAKTLVAKGHSFHASALETPGHFTIIYDKSKKIRRPDLTCRTCNITFEVKKRNRDRHFRVSHSEGRKFSSENTNSGWHVFVFPDMTPHFLSNTTIAQAIESGQFTPGKDRYDSWADIHGASEMTPPQCPNPSNNFP
ncbi:hypothetical protein BKM77_18335 [Pseudomonas syringae]|uniref:hypothetical protein n=1 Tax=Pseudomonas syringae TaxID=317 RepID=UPI000FFE5AEE|nr:hypothetical protein [Pseudomonas syringae]RXF63496.1 hypothetical protein BKM77_18335 [Pseudomonas syringae]